MRNFLLLSLLLAGTLSLTAAQTPPAATTPATPATGARPTQPTPPASTPTPSPATGAKPTQAPPAAQTPPATQTPPAARGSQPTTAAKPAASGRASTAAARSGIALTVTDMRGTPLPGIHVQLAGNTFRLTDTGPGGQVSFTLLQPGTYKLTFSGDAVTTFEREVTIPTGKVVPLDISLNPAPPPKEIVKEVHVAAPAAQAPAVGPLGTPQMLSLYDMAEKELKTKEPRPEILVACSGNLRSTLVFVTRDQAQRLYDTAEASYYVLGGEAVFHVGGDERTLAAGGYVAIPRGVPFTVSRRGNKSLSLLALLSGEPCKEGR